MKYELIRLFRDRYVRILIAIIFITSMLLFHHNITDSTYTYSYQQIGMKYSLNTDIEAEIRELDELIMNRMYEASDEYVTGWPSLEKRLDDHILERNTQALGYQDWRKQYLAENKVKISSGLFGDENSFDVRTLKKANAVYEDLCRTGDDLMSLIEKSRGGSNKDLEALTKELTDLIEKYRS